MKTLSIPLLAALLAASTAPTTASGSELSLVERGKRQFIRCSSCHSMDPNDNTFGPHLHSIVGRKSASVADYEYSELMIGKEDIVWTEEYLDEWMERPQEVFADICMPFMGISNPTIRQALIEYMKHASQ